jgi:molybdopterin synthase catalytic subunit/molybdopterin converting factor small subunit
MKIRLLAFASASDALGTGELDVDLPDHARIADLRAWLDARYPALAPLWPRLAVAVNGAVARADERLDEGSEVALLPPVSGGTEGAPGPPAATDRPRVELVDTPIDLQDVVSRVASSSCGAILLFLGTVRDHSSRHGQRAGVLQLTYTAYRPMACAALQRIASDLERATPGLRVAIVHRLGEIPLGEPSVAIATAARHRAAAYEASRQALERLKSEVPIWKLERYSDGQAAWREEESLAAPRQ